MEPYMTLKEVALVLGIGYQTVWRMVKDGELAAVRVRTRLRVPVSALESLPGYAGKQGGADGR